MFGKGRGMYCLTRGYEHTKARGRTLLEILSSTYCLCVFISPLVCSKLEILEIKTLMVTLKATKCKFPQNLGMLNSLQKYNKQVHEKIVNTTQIYFLQFIFFCSTSMSSIVEKAKDELQAFLEILIPSARSLRTNIEDQKL